jgi:hypothetical protein
LKKLKRRTKRREEEKGRKGEQAGTTKGEKAKGKEITPSRQERETEDEYTYLINDSLAFKPHIPQIHPHIPVETGIKRPAHPCNVPLSFMHPEPFAYS